MPMNNLSIGIDFEGVLLLYIESMALTQHLLLYPKKDCFHRQDVS